MYLGGIFLSFGFWLGFFFLMLYAMSSQTKISEYLDCTRLGVQTEPLRWKESCWSNLSNIMTFVQSYALLDSAKTWHIGSVSEQQKKKNKNIDIWVRSKFVGVSQYIIKKFQFLVCPKMNKINADGFSYKRYSKQMGSGRRPFSYVKDNEKEGFDN